MDQDKTKNGEITPHHTNAMAEPATPAGAGVAGFAESTASTAPADPAGEPARTRQEKLAELKRLEIVLQEGLPNEDRVAAALAEIQTQKLYRLAGHSSFRDYIERRWDFCRSRAYQLIAFHRATQRAQAQGAARPANERQSRAQATGGDRSPPAAEKFSAQTERYISKKFAQLSPDEQQLYLAKISHLVRALAARCAAGPPPPCEGPEPAHPVFVLQAAPATRSASPPPPPAAQPTSASFSQPPVKGTTTPGDQVVPAHPAPAAAAPPSQKPQTSSPPLGNGAARECPRVNFRGLPLVSMTMEEARRIGFR